MGIKSDTLIRLSVVHSKFNTPKLQGIVKHTQNMAALLVSRCAVSACHFLTKALRNIHHRLCRLITSPQNICSSPNPQNLIWN